MTLESNSTSKVSSSKRLDYHPFIDVRLLNTPPHTIPQLEHETLLNRGSTSMNNELG